MSRGTKDLLRGGPSHAARVEPQPPATSAASSSARRGSLDALGNQPDAVCQLKLKVEQQRRELDERTDNVNAIQRNFQRLSEMYAGDRGRITELERELAECRRELDSLKAEKKVYTALRLEFNTLQERYNSETEGSEARIAVLMEENSKLKKSAADLKQNVRMLQSTVEASAKQTESVAARDDALVQVATDLETFATTLFSAVATTQVNTAQLKQPVGLAVIGSGTVSSTMEPEDRIAVVGKSLQFAALNALPALQSAVEAVLRAAEQRAADSATDHQRVVSDLEACVRNAENNKTNAANALASEQAKLKELQKLFQLERQGLQGKASDGDTALRALREDLQAQLAKALAERNAFEHRLAQAEAETTAVKETKCRVDAELAVLSEALQRAVHDHDQSLAKLRVEFESATQENTRLGNQLSISRADAAKLRDSVAHLNEACNTLRDEFARGKLAWAKERDEAMEVVARSSGRSSTELRQSLDRALAELEDERRGHSATRGAKEVMEASLKRSLADADEVTEQLRHSALVKASECVALSEQVEDLREQLLKAQQANAAAASANGRTANDVLAKLAAADALVGELLEKLRATEADNTRLNATFKALADDARAASDAKNRAEAQLGAIAAERVALGKDVAQLKSALAQATDVKAAAEARLEACQRRAQAAEAEAREAKDYAQKLASVQDDSQKRANTLVARMEQVATWAADLKVLQRESIKCVKKVLAAEEASESGYSCQSCLEVMKDPVICAPCGHAICRECFKQANGGSASVGGRKGPATCPECDEANVTCVVPSRNLDLLSGKFDFRRNALKELSAMLDRTFASLESNTVAKNSASIEP
jgi:chromosome segregation ATPase